jgi:hypothetical protein
MAYNFISLCISVLSVSSVVKQKTVEITFNHRGQEIHGEYFICFLFPNEII